MVADTCHRKAYFRNGTRGNQSNFLNAYLQKRLAKIAFRLLTNPQYLGIRFFFGGGGVLFLRMGVPQAT